MNNFSQISNWLAAQTRRAQLSLLLISASCGVAPLVPAGNLTGEAAGQAAILHSYTANLQSVSNGLNVLIASDYQACRAAPSDGGLTSDALIRKICQVAQAATEEAKVELRGQLQRMLSYMQGELEALGGDVGTQIELLRLVRDRLYGTGLADDCVAAANCAASSFAGRLALLEGQLATAQADIQALKNLTAGIPDNLQAATLAIEIGAENSAAGTGYESVLRRADRKKIYATVDSTLSLTPSQGAITGNIERVMGSSTVRIRTQFVSMLVNCPIKTGMNVQLLAASISANALNLTTANVSGYFTVTSHYLDSGNCAFSVDNGVTSPNTGNTAGGSSFAIKLIERRGLSIAWDNSLGQRFLTATGGTFAYNYLILGASSAFTTNPAAAGTLTMPALGQRSGIICYSITDRSASAATILAGGANIICK